MSRPWRRLPGGRPPTSRTSWR